MAQWLDSASMTHGDPERTKFDELCFYTLAHGDPSFIHQLVVDAYTAQHADKNTKPIAVAFALIGLYLHIEKGYSGRQVQQAHMTLAKRRKQWPAFQLPAVTSYGSTERGAVSVGDVVAAPPGQQRDAAIERWCASVWQAWSASHEQVRSLVQAELWRQ